MAIPTSDMPGHLALHDRVHAALDTCVESQGIEFKESGEFQALKYKIIRTALAMGNLRDGGVIVIGASERGDEWDLTGILEEHLATYGVDSIRDAIDRFASPEMSAEVVLVPYRNSRRFLAIHIREFAVTPFVCRRDGPSESGLKQGSLYVRPSGVARTTEVRSAQQMHDLLDLAAEKRSRRFLETARQLGLLLPVPSQPFDAELEGL